MLQFVLVISFKHEYFLSTNKFQREAMQALLHPHTLLSLLSSCFFLLFMDAGWGSDRDYIYRGKNRTIHISISLVQCRKVPLAASQSPNAPSSLPYRTPPTAGQATHASIFLVYTYTKCITYIYYRYVSKTIAGYICAHPDPKCDRQTTTRNCARKCDVACVFVVWPETELWISDITRARHQQYTLTHTSRSHPGATAAPAFVIGNK